MTLTRRAPQRSVMPFRDVLDWVFDDPWRQMGLTNQFAEGGISIDLRETDDAFIVEAEMPGIKPEDTEVTLEGRTLVIRGRFSEEREEGGQDKRYLVRERRSGQVSRVITLPAPVDAENVKTQFENGELRIELPKAPETRARRIPIGSGSMAGSNAKRVGPESQTKR